MLVVVKNTLALFTKAADIDENATLIASPLGDGNEFEADAQYKADGGSCS
jgi:hypothetical protein